MSCTATLTTATVEPCDCVNTYEHGALYGAQFADHVTLHTLRCQNPYPGGHDEDHRWDDDTHPFVYVDWSDGTPGASPHVDPLVSDDEFSEALAAFQAAHDGDVDRPALAAALEAAARTRRGDRL